ncbi:MAG: carbamoyl-phosphate synthase large subunit [Oscillospiraceae bacterium]|nr:carbamoyl-phosphate synthase large subunit [Oscillospiraceae bacterium]
MPLDKSIKKVLVIGSGPIVIGQAAEFDYAGTQACKMLREDGIEIVLVNSNPATIMTDNGTADKIYIEPLNLATIKRIIKKERPDSILSGLGGQTGLTLCMQLAKDGFLDKYGVQLLGSSPETIDKAEDRLLFKETMEKMGQPCIPSAVANDVETALAAADKIGYPVIVRPAFTLGGSGGGAAKDAAQLREIAGNGIALSPISQVLIEKSIAGWKEIEFEVIRDRAGNAIIVCSMENVDPVGVHTGDSIVVAPALTLADKEYQMLRTASLDIVSELGVEGGCNVQLAIDPHSFQYGVIEVNPRVSRSSALASKATGYPIAKVSTKIALGYNLDEILNTVTGTTYAAMEPTIDYVALKLPKWPFDKFVYAKKDLGTQMKATGEVMSMGDTFELALLKAVVGAELGLDSMDLPRLRSLTDDEIRAELNTVTDERIFIVYAALKRGFSVEEVHAVTTIDPFFLHKIAKMSTESAMPKDKAPVYKMVDTCAGEYAAGTPYFYSIYNGEENEAAPLVEASTKERIIVLGSGPIRIGQGIEFDYAGVHCVGTLRSMGYEVIVINNNPETVSTDFDTADRLYFEPLTIDSVMNVVALEKPIGVIVAFGGGTAIKLTQKLADCGVTILGTSADAIDICEDRDRFDALLESLNIKRPAGTGVMTKDEALKAAEKLGYPVVVRPSYVLGGQNMIIAHSAEDVSEYMDVILRQKQDNPVLVDKYMQGREIEVDAICDGENVFIPGIMEHIERAGVHSGDSISVYPAPNVDDDLAEKLYDLTAKICRALEVRGLVNLQYVHADGEIYVIEVNPRASRTVPYISKITGIHMCDLATRTSMGAKLTDLGYGNGIGKVPPYISVKVPVFSFEKLTDVDTQLGPEMKSTGEVLGIGKSLEEALYKGMLAAGHKMKRSGSVFITVRGSDKQEAVDLAKKFAELGYTICATEGTAKTLAAAGLDVTIVNKIHENPTDNIMTRIEAGEVAYIISTSVKGRNPARDSVKIRRRACLLGVPCFTSLDTANALADSLLSRYTAENTELVDINQLRTKHEEVKIIKMHVCGNDFIYIDCMKGELNSPESLSVFLADRHYGVGGDGVVLIQPSKVADAAMRLFNYDGRETTMGGNTTACVGKYLYDSGLVNKKAITIETAEGVKQLSVKTTNGKASSVTVNMGKPCLSPEGVAKDSKLTYVGMGDVYAVDFTDNVDSLCIDTNVVPEGANGLFVKVVNDTTLRLRIWEQGQGETLACGLAACAAVVAAVEAGKCQKGADIRVCLPGGEVSVTYGDEGVFLTAGCKKVFEGIVLI